jgi:hypothetical protein
LAIIGTSIGTSIGARVPIARLRPPRLRTVRFAKIRVADTISWENRIDRRCPAANVFAHRILRIATDCVSAL